MSQYRKGYRREKQARDYMETKHNCVCMESRGSHGVADLICGNGIVVYVVQVKDYKHKSEINVEELRSFAHQFKAVPVVLLKEKYKPFHAIYY